MIQNGKKIFCWELQKIKYLYLTSLQNIVVVDDAKIVMSKRLFTVAHHWLKMYNIKFH